MIFTNTHTAAGPQGEAEDQQALAQRVKVKGHNAAILWSAVRTVDMTSSTPQSVNRIDASVLWRSFLNLLSSEDEHVDGCLKKRHLNSSFD